MSVPVWLRSAVQKAPTVLFLLWSSFKVPRSPSWEQQVSLAPCLADASGNDDLGKGFFPPFNLKASIFIRGADCIFLYLRIFLVMNTEFPIAL